jgi:large subunit ribosomal protein L31
MKENTHPVSYRPVVFQDLTDGTTFVTRSCVETKDVIKWSDGLEYPLFKVEISNSSHPYYTGKQVLVDTAGRVERFNKRFAKKA